MQFASARDRSCVFCGLGIVAAVLTLAGTTHGLQTTLGLQVVQPTTQPVTRPVSRPANQPATNPPSNQPANQPVDPAQRNPGQPDSTPVTDPRTAPPTDRPDGVVDQNDPNRNRTNARADEQRRFNRPFALSNPQDTARIDQAVERLTRLETRLAESNQSRMKQFGNVRTMRGDDLSNGLLTTIQQMLQDQQAMGEYLSEARGVWSGDMSASQAQQDLTNRDAMNNQRQLNAGVDGNAGNERRFNSPFAMANEEGAAQFSQQASRLMEQESELRISTAQRLRQLGEIRGMTGERQSQGLLELVQNVLNDQQAMAKYLRDARMAWSGDDVITDAAQTSPGQEGQSGNGQNGTTTPSEERTERPAPGTPGRAPRQPSNAPATQPSTTPRPK